MSPAAKLRWIYTLMVVFLALFSVQMGLFVAHQLQVGEIGPAFLIYLLFDLVIGYTLIRAIWRITAQAYLSRKWLKLFSANQHTRLTKQLNYKYRSLGTEIIVVQDKAFVALAIGMYRPKIVISTQVLQMFSADEVKVTPDEPCEKIDV